MALDVQLAMNIVQLTGILIPVLLGVTRYYLTNDNAEDSGLMVSAIVMLLFGPLFVAYLEAFVIIEAHGNPHLTTAVYAYGWFLVTLMVGAPLVAGQKWDAIALAIMGGMYLWIMA